METKGVHVEGLDGEPSPPVSVARSHHEVDVAVARLPGVATSRLGCSRRDLSIHIERYTTAQAGMTRQGQVCYFQKVSLF